jgi:hypothetical protein
MNTEITNTVGAIPSERSLEIAGAIYGEIKVTDEMLVGAARKIEAELADERETISRQRSEILALLGVIPTQSFLGKPVEYWINVGASVERLYDKAKGEQRLRLSSEANADRWIEMLKEIALIPTGKTNEETIAQAVTRYVGELLVTIDTARSAFREECERHNVEPPCEHYAAVDGAVGCAMCGHPFVVHVKFPLDPLVQLMTPVPEATEAAS